MGAAAAHRYVAVQGKDERNGWIELYVSASDAEARGVLLEMKDAGVPHERVRLV